MTPSRAALAALATAFLLVGCGGGDDDGATVASEPEPVATVSDDAPATTDSAPPGSTTGSAPDAPNATVSPDLPDEVIGEVGPVEVQGEPLLELGRGTAVADDPALGATAPIVIGQNFDGETVRIDAAANGPTMVVVLAHWCPHCNAEVPRINQLRDEGRIPEGLDIMAVSTAVSPGRPNFPPSQWFEDIDWTYPVLVDGVDMEKGSFIAADAYGVDAFPFTVLLDREGSVVARWSGEHDTDEILALITDNLG